MSKAVLVIDDHQDFLDLMGITLRRAGYEVWLASSAIGALKLLQERLPDCVVLDIMLPDRSGIEVLENIRWDARLAALPVICVSAANVGGESLAFINEFAVGLLDKADLHLLPEQLKQLIGPA
ncbi:MAG: response regulator [Candidatus Lambdaproteobacteria bacterium]|nr:response regulator [Candidatus Lambdaproteobacteria bacterium]